MKPIQNRRSAGEGNNEQPSSMLLPLTNKPVGAVMVVGGGVGGIQAALDLAEVGFKIYLVEREPSIGGKMAQLDKTFPTNDCSMCTLAPRLVECNRHPNIELLTCTEVKNVSGWAGNFRVTVRQRARFVDASKCTGCGECAKVCPVLVKDEFNQDLAERKAVYLAYPQAVPNTYAVDFDHCIDCGACEVACPAEAVNPIMGDREYELRVGAVILCPGYDLLDPSAYSEYGYGIHPNVVTSMQFERILSASGPYEGHVLRPSDNKEPRRIAFIQCVGSRDVSRGAEYCSSVCCMHSTKQALLAREHIPGVETTIFYIDIRAYGKDFEKYYNRACDAGVQYVRCMVSQVDRSPEGDRLIVCYRTPDGHFEEETFDMVVLAVGLRPLAGASDLAKAAAISLNEYGFAKTWELKPTLTSRPGIFVAGAFSGPKDIPETVVDASAAVANASSLLRGSRDTLTVSKTYPQERDVARENPRVGVFVCNCGINIGSVVNVPEVVRFAATLPGVVHAEEFLFACAADSIERIQIAIKEHGLNRVVVASCTPRTHAPLFQESLQQVGLNRYLFEFVNIREHCSWVHSDNPVKATAKAKDLVHMGVAKARLLSPIITTFVNVNPQALIVGGGATGMTSALAVAEQGFPVCLVEKEAELGGNLRHLYSTIHGSDPQLLLSELRERVEQHPLIKVITSAEVSDVTGYVGNYVTTVQQGDEVHEIEHGAVILATGGVEYRPAEYLYGEDPRVVTQMELEKIIKEREGGDDKLDNVVMIQCVGSRDETRPYCSRVCCGQAVKNALKIKEINPAANVYILYRDVRTYGLMEKYYRQAREKGVIFVRYEVSDKPVVEAAKEHLQVSLRDPLLNVPLEVTADLVVLSAAIEPHPSTKAMAQLFKVATNVDGFYAEAHMKLRPVDFASDGLYLAGLGHSPKMIGESLAQANAAAVRAVTLLCKKRLGSLGTIVTVDEKLCSGCGLCINVCPYGARFMDKEKNIAGVHEAVCRGCGTCAVVCPSGATQQNNFRDDQIFALIDAACQSIGDNR